MNNNSLYQLTCYAPFREGPGFDHMGNADNVQENDRPVKDKGTVSTYHYSGKNKVYQSGRGRTGHRAIVRAVKALDVLMVSIPFIMAWSLHYSQQVYIAVFYRRGNWAVIGLFIILYFLLSHLYGGFSIHISRISEIVYAQSLGALIANGIMFIVMWLLFRKFPSIPLLVLVFAAQVLLIILWARIAHAWYFKQNPPLPTAIIYDELEGLEKLISQYGVDKHFDIIRTIDIHELHGENWYSLPKEERDRREDEFIPKVLEGVEAVFLCSLHSHDRNQIVKYCVHKDIVSWCVPRIGDMIMSGASKAHMFHLPMLRVGRYNPTPEYLVVKRAFDIVVAGIALIIFSPVMVILAILIRRDGGTAFYRQKRLTQNGKVFEILKFRSMRMDAEKDGVARLSAGEDDPRITKIGKFIRACRLDELPQLFNILRGDMSIVGPRPERPEIAEQYKKDLPEFDLRLQCKCGLTGFAQVYGQYNTTPYDKLLMDLMYIAQPSMVEDFKICLATVKILFMKDSTEGIEAGQTTAVKVRKRENRLKQEKSA